MVEMDLYMQTGLPGQGLSWTLKGPELLIVPDGFPDLPVNFDQGGEVPPFPGGQPEIEALFSRILGCLGPFAIERHRLFLHENGG